MAPLKPYKLWSKLGARYYRSVCLFPNIFPIDDGRLKRCIAAGAPFGGAIAVHTPPPPGSEGGSSVEIINGAGKTLLSISRDNVPIVALGWSVSEQLLVVGANGVVHCYQEILGPFTVFRLWADDRDHTVLSCAFYSTGLVALLDNQTFVHIHDYNNPRIVELAPFPSGQVHSWALIVQAGQVDVLVAVGTKVFVVSESGCVEKVADPGPYYHVAASPNGQSIALYGPGGRVVQGFSDPSNQFRRTSKVSVSESPLQMVWCGNAAPMLVWDDKVTVVGPAGETISYEFDTAVSVLPESDGVRILANEGLYFLQRVPEHHQNVFRLNSREAGAYLLASYAELSSKSHKSHDTLQLIKDKLETAVEECVGAAGHEFDPYWQKQALFAASFGKSALDFYDADDFVAMFTKLRVLNAVRAPEVGMSLTYSQLVSLGLDRLIARLTSRHLYSLACSIAEYVKLPTDKVYAHWAIQKVKSSTDSDESVQRAIIGRLRGKLDVSFVEIAKAAHSEGRTGVAKELLGFEPRAAAQVELLLDMHEDEAALKKALESGDTDLMYHVLIRFRKKYSIQKFLELIGSDPVPLALTERWAAAHDNDDDGMLQQIHYALDRRADIGAGLVRDAIGLRNPTGRRDKLDDAIRQFKGAQFDFERNALAEAKKALAQQARLEEKLGPKLDRRLVGLSVHETVSELVKIDEPDLARRSFKIPAETFARIQLRTLVAAKRWSDVAKFADNDKSAITFLPFFNEALAADQLELAGKFVPKCADLKLDFVDMYARCGLYVKAVEEAVRLGKRQVAAEVSGRAGVSARDRAEIDQVLRRARWK